MLFIHNYVVLSTWKYRCLVYTTSSIRKTSDWLIVTWCSSDYVFSILLLVGKQTHCTKRIPIADKVKDLRNTRFKRHWHKEEILRVNLEFLDLIVQDWFGLATLQGILSISGPSSLVPPIQGEKDFVSEEQNLCPEFEVCICFHGQSLYRRFKEKLLCNLGDGALMCLIRMQYSNPWIET